MQNEVKQAWIQAWSTGQVVSTETIENDLELTLSEIGLTVTEEQAAKLVEFTKRYIKMAVESFNW